MNYLIFFPLTIIVMLLYNCVLVTTDTERFIQTFRISSGSLSLSNMSVKHVHCLLCFLVHCSNARPNLLQFCKGIYMIYINANVRCCSRCCDSIANSHVYEVSACQVSPSNIKSLIYAALQTAVDSIYTFLALLKFCSSLLKPSANQPLLPCWHLSMLY